MSSQDGLSAKIVAIPVESFLAFWIAMTDELSEEQKQMLAVRSAANATLAPVKTHETPKLFLFPALANLRIFLAHRILWTRSEPDESEPSK